MPELPEVTTTVKGLQRVLIGLVITDVWTDIAREVPSLKHFKGTLKETSFYKKFKKEVIGSKITKVERRAKNILIHLSNNKTILIHLKMTGHIIFGEYIFKKKENIWVPSPTERKALFDPFNRFIHVIFSLSNNKQFVFCDARKFGKVTLFETNKSDETTHLFGIGPEPLEESFTFEQFKNQLSKKPAGNIKTVLMDQKIIAGIGNIYSDEMLFISGIHPESKIKEIPNNKLKKLYIAMKDVLNKGIDFGGDSMSDYRNIDGLPGDFQNQHNVYRKTKEICSKKSCHGVILRKVVNGRSAHYCSTHQILFN